MAEWISVKDRLPKTIECTAGTRYSEALVVWTSGRKMLTAIFDGDEFITDCAFWDAEGEDVLYWMQPEPPKEQKKDMLYASIEEIIDMTE